MAIAATLVGAIGSGNGTLTTGGGTTTSGSTFLIALSYDASATLSTALSALDNKSNTYTQIGTTQTASGAKRALYYCANGTGGATHTASAAFSASSFGSIYLVEITGAAASPLDINVADASDATTPFTLGTGTLAQADELVIGIVGNGEGQNPMGYASSNMTELGQEGNGASFWTSGLFKAVVASTSSFVASFTSNGGNNIHAIQLATFKQGSGGGATVKQLAALGCG